MAGAGGTESLSGFGPTQPRIWVAFEQITSFPSQPSSPTSPIQFLNSAALGKAFKHQGEIPRVSQTASLIQARPSDCTFAKNPDMTAAYLFIFHGLDLDI